jgi:DNA-binding NtrC family response regulator
MTTPHITLESLNLEEAERQLCTLALEAAGNIVEAAKLLGVTRHALKRRIIKHKIAWHRSIAPG